MSKQTRNLGLCKSRLGFDFITESKIANFCLMFVGINAGLFVFRQVFSLLNIAYICAVIYLAIRTIYN